MACSHRFRECSLLPAMHHMPESRTFSAMTLEDGASVLANQRVKVEGAEDEQQMQQELKDRHAKLKVFVFCQDLMVQRARITAASTSTPEKASKKLRLRNPNTVTPQDRQPDGPSPLAGDTQPGQPSPLVSRSLFTSEAGVWLNAFSKRTFDGCDRRER